MAEMRGGGHQDRERKIERERGGEGKQRVFTVASLARTEGRR